MPRDLTHPWPCWTGQSLAKAGQQGTPEPIRNLALLALAPGVPRPAGAIQAMSRREKNGGLVMNKALMGGRNRGSRDGEPTGLTRRGAMALEDSWETRSQYDACQAPPERA